jgi:hypothetical protein
MAEETVDEGNASEAIVIENQETTGDSEPEEKGIEREAAENEGWTQEEIRMAEEHGLIKKPEKPEKAEKTEKKEAPVDEAVKDEAVKEEKKQTVEPEEKKVPRPGNYESPMTPEQEKAFLDAFGPGMSQRGLYFRMKNERQARQMAERMRDEESQRREALEKRISALEGKKPIVDEDGNEIDPNDQPLTMRQLVEWEKQKNEAAEQARRQQDDRAGSVVRAQRNQEEYARSVLPDFDETVKLAEDVLKNIDIVPTEWEKNKLARMYRELQESASNADKYDIESYNSAFIAYEIGRLHPEFSKKRDGQEPKVTGKSFDPKKADGGLTPEQMKRIQTNTQKRASSASVSGASSKRISLEDVTVETLLKLPTKELEAFKKKYPEKYERLLAGG